jgi:hypothetical protein
MLTKGFAGLNRPRSSVARPQNPQQTRVILWLNTKANRFENGPFLYSKFRM